MWRRHVDHIQDMTVTHELNPDSQICHDSTSSDQDSDAMFLSDSNAEVSPTVHRESAPSESVSEDNVTEQATSSTETAQAPLTSRYPKRVTKPPDRYM